ncbi:hypothetical protein BGZ60DRAFT_26740 [Tricladium varicosporioides]|nr:hypothetical protein BGZ60DRAFT_26740 [Hymenoscyphus varicosporioides]
MKCNGDPRVRVRMAVTLLSLEMAEGQRQRIGVGGERRCKCNQESVAGRGVRAKDKEARSCAAYLGKGSRSHTHHHPFDCAMSVVVALFRCCLSEPAHRLCCDWHGRVVDAEPATLAGLIGDGWALLSPPSRRVVCWMHFCKWIMTPLTMKRGWRSCVSGQILPLVSPAASS